jgi:hypothetical protein
VRVVGVGVFFEFRGLSVGDRLGLGLSVGERFVSDRLGLMGGIGCW